MDTIFHAVRDLIKFKIVASIDTGDKTYDNLIVLVLISIFTLIFSMESIKSLHMRFITYYYRDLKHLDTAQYLSTRLDKCPFELVPIKTEILVKLVTYLKDNCCHLYKRENVFIKDPDQELIIMRDISGTECSIGTASAGTAYVTVQGLFKDKEICPIFISEFGAVGIKGCYAGVGGLTSFLYFIYESKRALAEFKNVLETIPISNKESKPNSRTSNLVMKLFYYDGGVNEWYESGGRYPIYPDRSFDNIVSQYKAPLLRHLKQFEEVNNGKPSFNGFGSYNLGIMIYGLPGTGKTSFMKAICNHLKRNGHIYDMRSVRTSKQFKQMFKEVEKQVYIFDEFDCVQGVINREKNDEPQLNHEDCKKELKTRLLNLLAIQHTESKETLNITKEIESVKKEIKQLEELLNLETLLTVLDGPCEMRNRVIVAATNYIDRIDPALLRPGRFDVKIKLEEFNDEEAVELLEKMFAGNDYCEHIKTHKFKRLTPTNIINICHELHDLKKILTAISIPSK